MLALTGCFIALLYLTGLRSDRAGSRTVTEAGASKVGGTPEWATETSAARPLKGHATPASVTAPGLYRGHTAYYWATKFKRRTRQYQHARAELRREWQPTVLYALRLASAVFGVSYWSLYNVSKCESNHYVFARNGQYRGIFQEGPMFERGPFAAFGVFDPIANALTAAHTVSREGWRQWSCRP